MPASDRSPARPVTPIGILAERLALVRDRLAEAGCAAAADLDLAHRLAGGLDPYLSSCTTPESADLRRLAEHTRGENWVDRSDRAGRLLEQEMLSGQVEGQLLKLLVHLGRADRVLDVGMFTGYSALAMAEALPADGVVVACEIEPAVAELARQHFQQAAAGRRIDVRVGPARRTLAELAERGERFGLIFIDADKPGYLGYLNQILDGGLLDPHGVICVDNTLLQGQPYGAGPVTENGRAIAEFNRTLALDPRVEQVLLPLRDGLTLIRLADTPAG